MMICVHDVIEIVKYTLLEMKLKLAITIAMFNSGLLHALKFSASVLFIAFV